MIDTTLLYEDSKAQKVIEVLPSLLRIRGVLCNASNPVPGLPCLQKRQQDVVWDEQGRRYLTVTPWGLAETLGYRDLGHELYYARITPLYRLVEPKEGVSAPQAQVPDPGYAVLDASTGMVTIYLQDDRWVPVSVYNVRLNLDNLDVGGDKLLRLIRYNLARAGVPIYPTALYRSDSIPYPWEPREGWETDFRVAHASNKEVAVPLVGYALDSTTQEIVYLHIVGHKSAVRSIWATLNDGGNRKYLTIETHRYARGYSSHNYTTHSTPVDADLGLYRLLIVDRRAIDQEVDGRAYLLIPKESDAAEDSSLHLAFAARLNAVLPIPILPRWGERLRQEGLRGNLVRMCGVGGDVAAAYALTANARWTALVEGLVQSGELEV